MLSADAEKYLAQSRNSLAVARERASEGREGSYWSAWASAFVGRCRSLESLLPKLRRREAEARDNREANGKASDGVMASHFPRLESRSREAK